jgi:hypothetical protein
MSRTVVSGFSGSTSFSTLSQKTARLSGKIIEHKMFFLISSTTLYEKFLILRIIQRYMTINVHKPS